MQYIAVLEQKLRLDGANWEVMVVIVNTRVPFIRAFFKPYSIMCDITINNGLAVENTEILEHLLKIQPNAAKLCIAIKKYLLENKVYIKNYAVVLLVVFFLQQYNFLPSIETVQTGCQRVLIEGKKTLKINTIAKK